MRTPTTPLGALVLCAALTILAAAGCTGVPDPEPTPTPLLSWSAEDEAEAVAGAEQAVRDYWHVSSQCLADPPNTDPSCFDQVSVDDQLTQDRTYLKDAQDYGVHYAGEVAYVQTEKVVSVELSVWSTKEVILEGCTSAEDYDIVLSDGTSFIPQDKLRRTTFTYVVRKATSDWQVADATEDPEGKTC